MTYGNLQTRDAAERRHSDGDATFYASIQPSATVEPQYINSEEAQQIVA